ncbi:hypothetical protein MSG28_000661 [Choristoneura fumiferana]|uniref:Uncharacterized protein n=1 Tax=Choristoneura fumiferana TaxID=7141 RepID=A0ACC0K288_CHOFU|nr:hypothetical protein MSG28_000661 [Choristoneura fumiferana]
MKLGGAPAPPAAPGPPADAATAAAPAPPGPCARMSAMMAVQRSVLYIYGGVLEKDDKQFCLSDMYSLGEYLFGHATRRLPQHAHYAPPLCLRNCPTKLTPAHN